MVSQRFVIDTEPVRIDGSGNINLRDETLDLRLQGAPKHFQFLRVRAAITAKGSLAHPTLGVDAKQAVVQGGIAAALGFINPLASVIAFCGGCMPSFLRHITQITYDQMMIGAMV